MSSTLRAIFERVGRLPSPAVKVPGARASRYRVYGVIGLHLARKISENGLLGSSWTRSFDTPTVVTSRKKSRNGEKKKETWNIFIASDLPDTTVYRE